MELKKFAIPPDNSAYSVADGKEVVTTQLDGGAARYRKDIIGATSTVDASWILGKDEYQYLRSFFRVTVEKGAMPFLIDLILDDPEAVEHKVYFIPGSMRLTGQKGLTYWVSAQLEVYPNELSGYEEDYVELYNQFGAYWGSWLDKINQIVNYDLPEIL